LKILKTLRREEGRETHTNMPIIRINPDGSVRIAKKSGSDVRDVKPEELPLYNPALISDYNKIIEEQTKLKSGIQNKNTPQGVDAISLAMKQGGSEFVNKGKTKDERSAIAEEIAKMGGVSGYRQALPLKDLATEAENTGLTASTDLKSKIDRSLPQFEKDVPGGTGPIAGRLFDIPVLGGVLQSMASPETRNKRASAGQIMSLYQQMISGKVVSDAEVQRLQAFLPSGNKSETQNREDLNRLKNDIQSNMDLFEIAKREGLTANEAYDKYAKVENGKLVVKKPKTSAPSILQKSGVLPSEQPKSRFTIEAIE